MTKILQRVDEHSLSLDLIKLVDYIQPQYKIS